MVTKIKLLKKYIPTSNGNVIAKTKCDTKSIANRSGKPHREILLWLKIYSFESLKPAHLTK